MTLTEKWKKGELENDWYYIRTTNGIEKWEYIKQSHGFGYYETEWVLEVLAPVPSYEEWQELSKQRNQLIRDVKDLAYIQEENQQLKEKLEKAEATLLDIDGGWVTDETRSKISEYFVYAIGEKK